MAVSGSVVNVTGDFGEIDRIMRLMGRLATPAWKKGLNMNLAQEAQALVAEGFRKQRDPEGRAWKPSIRARLEGGQTLSKTGRLRTAWAGRKAITRLNAKVFTLMNRTKYAAIHQKGGLIKAKRAKYLRFKIGGRFISRKQVRIPARPMIPRGPGLPPLWRKGFERAAGAYFVATMGATT